jgi:hypothetical protein
VHSIGTSIRAAVAPAPAPRLTLVVQRTAVFSTFGYVSLVQPAAAAFGRGELVETQSSSTAAREGSELRVRDREPGHLAPALVLRVRARRPTTAGPAAAPAGVGGAAQ